MNRRRLLRAGGALALVGILSAVACADDSTLAIRPQGSLTDSTSLAGLEVEIEGRTFRAADLAREGGRWRTFGVPGSGELAVHVRLVQGGQVIVQGDLGWGLSPGFEYAMDVFRQSGDPTQTCFGCVGSAHFAIDAAAANVPGESLWIAWGGQPKDSDIVY